MSLTNAASAVTRSEVEADLETGKTTTPSPWIPRLVVDSDGYASIRVKIPSNLLRVIDERGDVTWSWRRTGVALVFGERAALAVARAIDVSLLGSAIRNVLILAAATLYLLSLWKVVPEPVCIFSGVLASVWIVFSAFQIFDVRVLYYVCLCGQQLWVNVAFSVVGAVSFFFILDGDYRGAVMLPLPVLCAFSAGCVDALPRRLRIAVAAVVLVIPLVCFSFIIIVVNLGLIPGQINRTIYTLDAGAAVVPITAYGVLNTSFGALCSLLGAEIVHRAYHRHEGFLRSATLALDGTDEDIESFATDFSFFDGVVPWMREHRR